MSSIPFDTESMGRAEKKFHAAFERLKIGAPLVLPKGSRVTQNNVAKEAGAVPSALRRARFPSLVDKIQAWIIEHGDDESQLSTRQKVLGQRHKSRELRTKMHVIEAQRDDALAKLVCAEALIVELTVENERLKSNQPPPKVNNLRPKAAGRPKR